MSVLWNIFVLICFETVGVVLFHGFREMTSILTTFRELEEMLGEEFDCYRNIRKCSVIKHNSSICKFTHCI